MVRRLPPQPGEAVDRETELGLTWNGRRYPALAGDTIASALAACGVRVFSRSLKYHRPRGLLTADHLDPNCTVQVGTEPNVRAAHRLVREGMQVRAQDAWPSLEHDAKAVVGLFPRLLPPGFYYKTFARPRAVWPAYERVLRRFAHGGRLDTRAGDQRACYDQRFSHPDVLVAGGGPAGMAAAVAAAEAGAEVLLVEERHALGGHLRWGSGAELTALAELRDRVAATPGIEVLTDAVALGRYDDNWVAVLERDTAAVRERLTRARAGCLVVAPGLVERPYVFAGNDLPGVMLSTAVRRLVNLYAVRPGSRAVVLSANPAGDAAAADLERVGVDVVDVQDARAGGDLVRVRGRGRVEAVEVAGGATHACDLVVVAAGWTAPTTLLNMAGDRPTYDHRSARFRPDESRLPAGVLATGHVLGDGSTEQLVEHGEATGREAARRATPGTPHARGGATRGTWVPAHGIPPLRPDPHPALVHGRTHGFVDLCEDVTSTDLLTAVEEGYDHVELTKRYTTATMGPTQGRLETVNVTAIVAEATGRTIDETGTTTWRPPYAPVTLGALAGRARHPVRRSPMQSWHERHGAVPLVGGSWVRPDHYGDPAGEVRAVRERVGMIDVTPIGKLDLRGPDVPALLDLLHVNRLSTLGIGRVRYGVMCAEDGVVLDDGVTGRLGEQHYLVSTTSSGADAVAEWMERWLQVEHPDWQVHVTPLTSAFASVNVAGPRSRELVARVVDDVDVGPEAFPYLHVRTGSVAGVPGCLLWRIGFTGELSYELHVPAGYGLHVWERLLEAGRDLGVRPFGVEAQRVLRLEKGHLIVGQDTDGLTDAFSAGLGGLVKLDKDDFVGRPALVDGRGDRSMLGGLLPVDGEAVPPEGSQVVAGGTIRGRITSSRLSPTLGHAICLAQVAAELAEPGTLLTVRLPGGGGMLGRVTQQLAQYDPEGMRLRA
jgi:sarcosine oxidase subunit alpha